MNISRDEFNKSLNQIKKLILSGYTEDSFTMIQQYMSYIRESMVPNDFRTLGEFVRNSYTDSVDTKELNQFIKSIKVEEN
jgi:hypothetical protein